MQERLLHIIWQQQHFSKLDFTGTKGEKITIIKPGTLNNDAGPDFTAAELQIDGLSWHGDVEIHTEAHFWYGHNHQHDPQYNKVILHVVYNNNGKVATRHDGTEIATLELKNYLNNSILTTHRELLNSVDPVACSAFFAQVNPLVIDSQWQRALVERLSRKASELITDNAKAIDWQQTAYTAICKAFGFKKNSEAMLALSRNLPYRLIQKHANSLLQIEALLFGVSGLLPVTSENGYITKLIREWKFLAGKFRLEALSPLVWKFHRMRPANFPTLRLAQLATLLHQQPNLGHWLAQTPFSQLEKDLKTSSSVYWNTHYTFSKESSLKNSRPGKASIFSIIINAALPYKAAKLLYTDNNADWSPLFDELEILPAENNNIIRLYTSLGLKNNSAYDSQAMLEQYANYCLPKRCLYCQVGLAILKR